MRAFRVRRACRLVLLAALSLGLLLVGCDEDEVAVTPMGLANVEFVAQVGGADLVENELIYTNAADQDFSVTKVHFLITDVRLHRTSGSSVLIDEAVLGNSFDNKAPTAVDIPAGIYDKVTFHWGKEWAGSPEVTHTLPSDFDFLDWPVMNGGGYHCMRFEGNYTAVDPGDQAFKLHMGRLERFDTTTDTSAPIELLFAQNLVIKEGEEWNVEVAIDLKNFMNDPVYDFTERVAAPGGRDFWCDDPGDPECDGLAPMHGPVMPNHVAQQRLFDNIGDVFSVLEVQQIED